MQELKGGGDSVESSSLPLNESNLGSRKVRRATIMKDAMEQNEFNKQTDEMAMKELGRSFDEEGGRQNEEDGEHKSKLEEGLQEKKRNPTHDMSARSLASSEMSSSITQSSEATSLSVLGWRFSKFETLAESNVGDLGSLFQMERYRGKLFLSSFLFLSFFLSFSISLSLYIYICIILFYFMVFIIRHFILQIEVLLPNFI
tara:strand:- start:158 stop:760 length:603 start_codon:yes stop_codon:yes gene_type:complete